MTRKLKLTVVWPHIALQAVLPPGLVPIASTALLFAMTASCSILLAVGQVIFQASLTSNPLHVVSQEEADMPVAAGAADLSCGRSQLRHPVRRSRCSN